MDYVIVCLIGVFGGGFIVFIALDSKRKKLEKQRQEQEVQLQRIRNDSQAVAARQQELEHLSAKFAAEHKEFSAKLISYQELQGENVILKRDLKNLDQNVRKLALDRDRQRQTQETLNTKVEDLGNRYLKENVRWIGTSLNPNNFSNCKQRLQDVIERCRGVGFDVSTNDESALISDL
jgi:chromosome segregation ATPase